MYILYPTLLTLLIHCIFRYGARKTRTIPHREMEGARICTHHDEKLYSEIYTIVLSLTSIMLSLTEGSDLF